MKAQDIILLGGAALAVWWLLKTYGGAPAKTAAAAPKYWVTGGVAVPDQFTSFPDPGVQGGVWV